jgi:hypothetical protein
MGSDIRRIILECIECALTKSKRNTATGMFRATEYLTPRQAYAIDIVSVAKSVYGNTCIMTAIDLMSRFTAYIPMSSHTAAMVCRKFLDRIVWVRGIPQILLHDGAAEFVGRLATDLAKQMGYKQIVTRHWPQANGVCENANIFLGQALRLLPPDRRKMWCKYCSRIAFVVNSTVNSNTTFSPFQLDNGTEANDIFGSLLTAPANNLTVTKVQTEKHYSDLKQTVRLFHRLAHVHSQARRAEQNLVLNARGKPKTYAVGDIVVVYVPSAPLTASKKSAQGIEWNPKHLNDWRGPCTVQEQTSPQSYVLRETASGMIVKRTVANIRKYAVLTDFRIPDAPVPAPAVQANVQAPAPKKSRKTRLFEGWNPDTMDTLDNTIVLVQEKDVYWFADVLSFAEGGINVAYYSTQGRNLKTAKFYMTYIEQGTGQVILGKPKPTEKADLWTGFAPFEDIKVRDINITKSGKLQAQTYDAVSAYQKSVKTGHACV